MLQRGITLYNNLLFDDIEVLPKREHNGRCPELLNARDNLLLHRLYFKTCILRKNYPDTFKDLEDEFFISVTMIQKIFQKKSDEILLIKRAKPTVSQLRSKFPFMNWN